MTSSAVIMMKMPDLMLDQAKDPVGADQMKMTLIFPICLNLVPMLLVMDHMFHQQLEQVKHFTGPITLSLPVIMFQLDPLKRHVVSFTINWRLLILPNIKPSLCRYMLAREHHSLVYH